MQRLRQDQIRPLWLKEQAKKIYPLPAGGKLTAETEDKVGYVRLSVRPSITLDKSRNRWSSFISKKGRGEEQNLAEAFCRAWTNNWCVITEVWLSCSAGRVRLRHLKLPRFQWYSIAPCAQELSDWLLESKYALKGLRTGDVGININRTFWVTL